MAVFLATEQAGDELHGILLVHRGAVVVLKAVVAHEIMANALLLLCCRGGGADRNLFEDLP